MGWQNSQIARLCTALIYGVGGEWIRKLARLYDEWGRWQTVDLLS